MKSKASRPATKSKKNMPSLTFCSVVTRVELDEGHGGRSAVETFVFLGRDHSKRANDWVNTQPDPQECCSYSHDVQEAIIVSEEKDS